MEHRPNIPQHARTALAVLNAAQHDAWIVGGFVRDLLRGVEAHDVDIATDAPWESVKSAFLRQGFAVHETGTKHGTVTVMVHGHPVEITTYRCEGTYSDARHPDSVTFVKDVQTDLARRDFTMNAIAYHPDKGFTDPFQGKADIRDGIIRCVGDPARRFAEDALRIMRAARFCSQLGFRIHQDTLNAMNRHAGLLPRVACERLQEEMRRFLLGPHVRLALPQVLPVVRVVIPELERCAPPQISGERQPQAIQRMAVSVAYAPQNEPARYAALFLAAAAFYGEGAQALEPGLVRCALKRLRVKKAVADQAALLAELAQTPLEPASQDVHAFAIRARGSKDAVRNALAVQEALALAAEYKGEADLERIRACQEAFRLLEQQGAPLSIKDLAVTGSDLARAGIPQGPRIGEALTELLWACAKGEVKNSSAELLSHLGFFKTVK